MQFRRVVPVLLAACSPVYFSSWLPGQSLPVTTIAASGQLAPGHVTAPSNFNSLGNNFGILSNGAGGYAIGFTGTTTGEYPSGPYDHGIWVDRGLGQGLQLATFDLASAVGSTSYLYAPDDLVMDANGDVAFNDIDLGLSILPGGGTLTNLIGGSGTMPGTNYSIGQVVQPVIDPAGHLAFGVNYNVPNGQAVYTTAWNNSTTGTSTTGTPITLAIITGGAAPLGGTYTAVSAPLISGTSIYTQDTAAYQSSSLALVVATSPAGDRLIARQGDPVPGLTGYTFSGSQTRLSVDNGQLAFESRVKSGSTTSDELFLDSGSGPHPLLAVNQPAPGGGTFSNYIGVTDNATGEVFFDGDVLGGTSGLFTVGADGVVHTVALQNQAAPGLTGYTFVGIFSAEVLSDTGLPAFAAECANSTSTINALYVQDTNGALDLIAYVGESLPVGPGLTNGTVSSINFDGDAAQHQYFAGNNLVYGLSFKDGRGGIYEVSVPEPSLAGLAGLAGTLSLLGLRRRRRGAGPVR
jgi:hypothetical protein